MKTYPLRRQINQRQFGGGGSPTLPTVPNATPPVGPDSAAVTAVQQNTYRQGLRRKGMSSTMLAGATGGYQPVAPAATTGPAASGAAPSVSTGGFKTG